MADIKNYAVASNDVLEQQIDEFANSPAYRDSKIRIMPDGHAGKGAVVGSTITYTDAIIPNTVGVDIACRVSLFTVPPALDLVKLDEVIHEVVPVGFSVRDTLSKYDEQFDYSNLKCWESLSNQDRIRLSMGSLGGGNHYISIDKDNDNGQIYLCIHTGSRNLGKQVCEYYQTVAVNNSVHTRKLIYEIYDKIIKSCRESGEISRIQEVLELRDQRLNELIPAKGLEYLANSYMYDYLHDMALINEWSWLNHLTIADAIGEKMGFTPIRYASCIHNYVDVENKIIRKGAISAYEGEIGIIPLNMRDGVLIVRGKGNEDWNYSLPHGAGRIMSRSEARNNLSMNDFEYAMKNIYTTCVQESTLDEAPMAYKDAQAIIQAIEPNAEIITHLQEVYNFKATK